MRGLPSRAVVDLGAIRDNVAALAAHAGSAEVMAVVKADGYGHGLLPSARAAVRGGATWLGVAQLAEALALRAAGLTVAAAVLAARARAATSPRRSPPTSTCRSRRSGRSTRSRPPARRARPHRPDPPQGRHRPGPQRRVRRRLARAGRPRRAGWRPRAPSASSASGRHFAYADAPDHPTVRLQQERFVEAVALAERAGCRPGGAAPRQLGRHADQPRRPLRPRPARARGLRPVAGAGPR